MMIQPFRAELFQRNPIVGILRSFPTETIHPIVKAVLDGGLTCLEVTMNSPGAAEQIRIARSAGGDRMNIGAGTVTTLKRLEEALEAGVSFIVTPTLAPEVIARCVELKVPVFPGAFTPTEISRAWDMGATMVKVFPAEVLGPGYLRAIKAPLPHVRLMPTGGVDLETIGAYRQSGGEAVGVGSPLFKADRVAASDWAWLQERARALSAAWELGSPPARTLSQT
jgi:2-dehydro-3-deoxyphosphogluconate aldolase/(4S)-4-hydroxy-2-oxoglutarate aldolase